MSQHDSRAYRAGQFVRRSAAVPRNFAAGVLASDNPATLADAAETWARSRRLQVPARGSAAWSGMFNAWQRSINPGLLIRHLSAAEQLAALLRSWHWHAVVERRAGGWTVNTNAAQAHVLEALRRTGIALESLPPTPGRTPNRSEIGEFSGREAALGSLASSRSAPVLDLLARGFAGGRAFTRDELANEAAGVLRGAHGQHLSQGSVGVKVGHALSEIQNQRIKAAGYRTCNPDPSARVRQMQGKWWVRSFGSLTFFPSPFATKREALAKAAANEAHVKEFAGVTDADEFRVLAELSPQVAPARTVKLSKLVRDAGGTPPGGWGDADRVGNPRHSGYWYGYDSATGTVHRFTSPTHADIWRRGSPANHGGTRRGVDPWPIFEGERAVRFAWKPAPAFVDEFGYPPFAHDVAPDPTDLRHPTARGSNPTGAPLSGPILETRQGDAFIEYRPKLARGRRPRIRVSPDDEAVLLQTEADEMRMSLGRKNAPAFKPANLATCQVCGNLEHASKLRGGACPYCVAMHGSQMPARLYNAPRSKQCRIGFHDFEPATGLCRRSGCEAFHHAGQGTMFGRDLDPTAVREALAREAATGQRDMFGRIVNPLTPGEAHALVRTGAHFVNQAREMGSGPHAAIRLGRGLESVLTAMDLTASEGGPAWDIASRRGGKVIDAARVTQDRILRGENPLGDVRDKLACGAPSPLVWATATGPDRARALRFGVDHGGGRFAFTPQAWAALLSEKNGGRQANPLSVLVLGANAPGSPQAGRHVSSPAANPEPGRVIAAPPANTPGLAQVKAHCRLFHGAPVKRWRVVELDDGKPGVTTKAVTALGLTEATVYRTPWRASNKHAGGVYEHVHETKKPLEVYDPVSNTSMKLLADGSGPSDWWRDDRDPRTALTRRKR